MPDYKYLIIGGGMTGDAAVKGIRKVDPEGTIGVIGAETHAPYSRPPLSKGLWHDKELSSIWKGTAEHGAELHLGRRITEIDPGQRSATADDATTFGFQTLLLATGGNPRRLPFGADEVIYFRSLDDYERLHTLAEDRKRFLVVGGGFIGSEIAAALASKGRDVVMAFPEDGVGSRVFPPDLAAFVTDYYREKGVEVLVGASVTGVERRGESAVVLLRNGSGESHETTADGVVAGIGIIPETSLAEAAGLAVDDGIVVDEMLRTSAPHVFAAGDVARFHNPALGRAIRVEHEDNALTMGDVAGRNMAGEMTPYHHLPFFYSDLFDLGYEAVGELDPRLETVADWHERFRQGVVYYLGDGRVRGVLLWNVWGKVDEARALIAEAGPIRPADLEGRIANG
jgi:3-phenylpropionate/trans-cinnamate dioxygenase ferredoxin reductase component